MVATAHVTIRPQVEEGWHQKVQSQTEGGIKEAFGQIGAAAGGALVAGIATAVAGGTALANLGGQFDQAFDTIRVRTGETGVALNGLQDSFRNVAATVPEDFGQVGQAVADLNTRLGLTGQPLEDLARQMLDLSRITGTDLNANLQAVPRLLNDWSIPADAASTSLDTLFRGTQATGVGFDKLSTMMVTFGAPMRQLGFGFTETAALIGSFEKAGVRTELVMGAMRIGLGKLAAAGETDIPRAFRESITAIEGAGSASEATSMAIELFGQRAGPDMAAAIREGRFSIDDMIAAMEGGTDTISGLADETADWPEKLGVAMNNMKLAVEPAATSLFDALGTAVDQVAPRITESMANLAPVLAQAVSGMIPPLMDALTKVVDVFAQLGGPLVQALAGLMPVLAEAFGGLATVATDALKPVFEAFADVLPQLAQSLGPALSAIVDGLQPVAQALGSVLADAVRNLAPVVGTLAQSFGELVKAIGPAVAQAIQGVGQALTGISIAGISALSGVLSGLAAVIGPLEPLLAGVASAFVGWKIVSSIIGPLENATKAVGTFGTKLAEAFAVGGVNVGPLAGKLQTMQHDTTKLAGQFPALGVAATAGFAVVSVALGIAAQKMGEFRDDINGVVDDLSGQAWELAKKGPEGLRDAMAQVGDKIQEFRTQGSGMWDFISPENDLFEDAANRMDSTVFAAFQKWVEKAREVKEANASLTDEQAWQRAGHELGYLTDGLTEVERAAENAKAAMDRLAGIGQNMVSSNAAWFDGLENLKRSVAELGPGLDESTAAGARNSEAFARAGQSAKDYALAAIESGKPVNEVLAEYTARYGELGAATGAATEEVDALAARTGLLPSEVQILLEAKAAEAQKRVEDLKGKLEQVTGTHEGGMSRAWSATITALLDEGKVAEAESKFAQWEAMPIEVRAALNAGEAEATTAAFFMEWQAKELNITAQSDVGQAKAQLLELTAMALQVDIHSDTPEAEANKARLTAIVDEWYQAHINSDTPDVPQNQSDLDNVADTPRENTINSTTPDVPQNNADLDNVADTPRENTINSTTPDVPQNNADLDNVADTPRDAPITSSTPNAGETRSELDSLAVTRWAEVVVEAVGVAAARSQINSLTGYAGRAVIEVWKQLMNADGGIYKSFANGTENHVAQISPPITRVWAEPETGGEAYIPLSPAKRARSLDIWTQVGRLLGVPGFGAGAIVGGKPGGDSLVVPITVDGKPAEAALAAMMEAFADELSRAKLRVVDFAADGSAILSEVMGATGQTADELVTLWTTRLGVAAEKADVLRRQLEMVRVHADNTAEAAEAAAGGTAESWAEVANLVDDLRGMGLTDDEIAWMSALQDGAFDTKEEFVQLVTALQDPDGGIPAAEAILEGLARKGEEVADRAEESSGRVSDAWGQVVGLVGDLRNMGLTDAEIEWLSHLEAGAVQSEEEFRRLVEALAGPGGIRMAEDILLQLGRTTKETGEAAGTMGDEGREAGGDVAEGLGEANTAADTLKATMNALSSEAAAAAWQLTQAATGASYLEEHARRAEAEARRLLETLNALPEGAMLPGANGGSSSPGPVSAPGTIVPTVNVTVNNPAPEPAGDSVTRKMRQLANAGLFG